MNIVKVMKELGNHEGCIEQINRLFTQRLYVKNENGDDVKLSYKLKGGETEVEVINYYDGNPITIKLNEFRRNSTYHRIWWRTAMHNSTSRLSSPA